VSELGGRFEEYHPNDPVERMEYYSILVGKTRLLLDSKDGRVARIGADWRDIPLMLRIVALCGAERCGWRWLLYWLWQRFCGSSQAAEPGPAHEQGSM
jgi:hypothetical protein